MRSGDRKYRSILQELDGGGDPSAMVRRMLFETRSGKRDQEKTLDRGPRRDEGVSRKVLTRLIEQLRGVVDELQKKLDLTETRNRELAEAVRDLKSQIAETRVIPSGYSDRGALLGRISHLEDRLRRSVKKNPVARMIVETKGPTRYIDVASLPD